MRLDVSPWTLFSVIGRRLGVVGLGIAVIAAAAPAFGQDESTDIRYVEITALKVVEDGKNRVIQLKAKSPVLPVGCKVEFLLTWRYQVVQRWVLPVPSNKRFDEEFEVKSYTASPEPYSFRTQLLELKDQKRSVAKEMEGDPETFPPGAVPWAEFHTDRAFQLGSAAEIAAETQRIQKWFKDHYVQIAGIDRSVANAAKAIREGTESDYVDTKGEFQEKKWRLMMDNDVLKPLRIAQKEILKGLMGKSGELIAYRRPLADLRELANAVAWRTTLKSIDLYKEKGLDPAEEDTKPEDVQTTVRGFKRTPPKSADLGKMVKRIDQALGIGASAKKPDAEKEGSR